MIITNKDGKWVIIQNDKQQDIEIGRCYAINWSTDQSIRLIAHLVRDERNMWEAHYAYSFVRDNIVDVWVRSFTLYPAGFINPKYPHIAFYYGNTTLLYQLGETTLNWEADVISDVR